MPKQLPPLNELSFCFTCFGCNLLESPKHSGVVKCDNYKLGYPEHYKRMNKDYGASVDAGKYSKEEIAKYKIQQRKEENNKIVDKYWKGD